MTQLHRNPIAGWTRVITAAAAVAVMASARPAAEDTAHAVECDSADMPPPGARAGRLLVTNQGARSVSLIDLASGRTAHVPVDGNPHGGAISPDGRFGVVADYGVLDGKQLNGNRVFVLDIATARVARTISTGDYRALHDVAFVPGSASRVIITAQRHQHVVEVDVERGIVLGAIGTRGESSHSLTIARDARTIFTANEEDSHVSRLDLDGRAFVAHIALDGRPLGIAITPDGRNVWVGLRGSVAVIDVARGAVAAVLTGAAYPDDIAASADGRRIAIADAIGNQVLLADAASRSIIGRVAVDRPHSVELHPAGRVAYATLGRSDQVAVIDVDRACVIARHAVQDRPDEVSWGAN